jgi:hypothetical protein
MGFWNFIQVNFLGIGSHIDRKECKCGRYKWCKETLEISTTGSVKRHGMFRCHKNREEFNNHVGAEVFKDDRKN